MTRVVITGMGCITPIGASPTALWQSLESGQSGIAPLPAEDPTLKFRAAGQITNFTTETLTPTQLQTAERCSHLGILAARQAAAQSQLTQHHDPSQIAILLGCSTAGRSAEEPEIARVYTQNARVHPLTIPRSMASNGASQVAIDQQITGPAITLSTACASGAHAIGMAFHMIRAGTVTAALAGAHEAPLTRAFLRAWDSMRVVSPTSCRPFSADRDGMTLAEGSAVLALETLESARARNAPIFAEILGFGMATDAHHITQPRPEGPAQAIHGAIQDAARTLQTTPEAIRERIAYINAHATATHANDATEAAAIHAVFGSRAPSIPVSGTKGSHGHSLGASSAIETLITALALHHRRLPFTAGTDTPDPALNLDLILHTPRDLSSQTQPLALTNSLAFGGLNAILCLGGAPA
jgi:3-oxoacyl-[acyl-carrier-protein] synthase II/nodulation protein E